MRSRPAGTPARTTRRLPLQAAALGLGAALVLPALAAPATADPKTDWSPKLQKQVTLEGVMKHLRAFQQIADANDGTRASGTPGYDDSAEYVGSLLERAGYVVTYQEFLFDAFVVERSDVFVGGVELQSGVDYNLASYSGDQGTADGPFVAVDVNEPPGAVPNSNTSGCEMSDFAGFPVGATAVVQRGTCPFGQKAFNAQQAGADGVVIYNEGTTTDPSRQELLNPTLARSDVTIPVIGVSYELGRQLLAEQPEFSLSAEVTLFEDAPTVNVIAETPGGNPDNVVMVGAHLDSDPAGPGINDNGTGSAAILETALQLRKTNLDKKLTNKIRFAFWGAEEAGLLGSNHYVANLSDAELEDIALYLNFDMVGSPNYFRGVYDGTGDLGGTAPRPAGSAGIETLFNSYFDSRGLPYEDTEFSGRSDYQAFILNGIPAGGLFTGAEGDKTAAQVARYGGILADYDPCYHQACDSFTPVADGADADLYARLAAAYGSQLVGNVNTFALDTNADAIAHAVATLGYSTASVNGVQPPAKNRGMAKKQERQKVGPQKAAAAQHRAA